ncbi:MAG: hypothetical protein HC897_06250 [Thermoanaerobaculia bacterium]|nr:hypothetical protein [Thermoanaerobaculia bacterium]
MPPELGYPLIRTVIPQTENAETQSFAIATDPRGLLYVANLAGVLVYDGAWWRLIPVGSPRTAFSLAVDTTGRVAVGGVGELGYLDPGPDGSCATSRSSVSCQSRKGALAKSGRPCPLPRVSSSPPAIGSPAGMARS